MSLELWVTFVFMRIEIMKFFSILKVLSGNQDISEIPGCENYELVKDTNVQTCCPSLPAVENSATRKCKQLCKGKGFCCIIECYFRVTKIADSSGKFDLKNAKNWLASVAYKAKYVSSIEFVYFCSLFYDRLQPVDQILDGCVERVTEFMEEWREENSEEALKYVSSKCPNFKFLMLPQCIQREITLACPDWSNSVDCEGLQDFAKTCPKFPLNPPKSKKTNDKEQ